jgi:hypothetical protein
MTVTAITKMTICIPLLSSPSRQSLGRVIQVIPAT